MSALSLVLAITVAGWWAIAVACIASGQVTERSASEQMLLARIVSMLALVAAWWLP